MKFRIVPKSKIAPITALNPEKTASRAMKIASPLFHQIAVSNTETIAGATIVQSLGLVTGSTVRAKNIGKDIMAGLKNIVGGELGTYTQLLNEARNQALQRMMADAQARGANAVVNVRFATSAVAGGAAELFAYGTAVIVQG